MSARFLLAVFDSVYVVALTAWVGSILFFSFGVAPLIFRILGAESGAQVRAGVVPALLSLGCDLGGGGIAGLCGWPAVLP